MNTPPSVEVISNGMLGRVENHIRALIQEGHPFDHKKNIYPVLKTSADTCRKWEQLALIYNEDFRDHFQSYQPYNLHQIWVLGYIASLREQFPICSDEQFASLVQQNINNFTVHYVMENMQNDLEIGEPVRSLQAA